MGKYILDYFSKYYFFEESNFIEKVKDGEYILKQLKHSNRFDYKGFSYKYTKFNNISMGETKKNVEVEFLDNNINILLDGKNTHLDLIYKFETKTLEDHIRIATRISKKYDDVSCLLYINHKQAKDFILGLENVKKLQLKIMND